MRFSLAILAASVAAVSAQSITDLPTCAQSCAVDKALAACTVPASDLVGLLACVCASPVRQRDVATCAELNGCSPADSAAATTLCAAVTGSATDGSASETGSAAPTGSSTTPPPSGSTTRSTSPSSTTKPGNGATTIDVAVAAVVGAVAAMML